MPTTWDRLAAAGVSHLYYFCDVPFLALCGTTYLAISRTYPQFLADAAAGTLPAVSFLDPRLLDEGTGTSADDHPHADIRAGQYFLNQVYQAVTASPLWLRTALVINYDEWGGFFDQVALGTAPDARPDLGTGLRGFRAPCLLVSPGSQRRYIAHGVYDHTSVLKVIEWRWNLRPLTRMRRGSRHPGRGIRLRRRGQPRRAAVERARLHRCAVPGRTVRGLRRLEPTRRARQGRRMAGADLRRLLRGGLTSLARFPGRSAVFRQERADPGLKPPRSGRYSASLGFAADRRPTRPANSTFSDGAMWDLRAAWRAKPLRAS